jgi:hypothetical protein
MRVAENSDGFPPYFTLLVMRDFGKNKTHFPHLTLSSNGDYSELSAVPGGCKLV